MCAWQEFKYRMLLLRAADCISRSLLHSRIHVTYIVVNRYMIVTVQLVAKKNGNCQHKIDTFLQFFHCETFLREIG
jgi:hypothetical protein